MAKQNRRENSDGSGFPTILERRQFLKILGLAGGAAVATSPNLSGRAGKAQAAEAGFTEHLDEYPRLVANVPAEPVTLTNSTVANTFIEVCNQNGVECLFMCPGTDTFPLQEAFAHRQVHKQKTPKLIMSIHEIPAMAAAHGYFMITGRPQVLMVHVDVGTMNVGGNLHNAYRGRAGVVFCAGRSPLTDQGELPGSRDFSINWLQEDFDQGGIVRNFVKWEYQLARKENAPHVIQRAFQVAGTEPAGPVYLTFPREILMEQGESVTLLPPQRYGPAAAPSAPPKLIEQMAEVLVKAASPVIATSYAGRHPGAVPSLVQLAELLAAPVVEVSRQYMNFPTDHDLYLGTNLAPLLKDADAALLVDTDIPYTPGPLRQGPRPGAKVFQLDIDPIKQGIPIWGYPQDAAVTANSAVTLPQLATAVGALLTSGDRQRLRERRQRITARHAALVSRRKETLAKLRTAVPIAQQWVFACLNAVYDEKTIIVDEGVVGSLAGGGYLNAVRPLSYFSSGGSSLGWGIGAALGAKLASPDSRVICVCGDGSYVFGVPTATIWAAKKYGAPFLTVIFNNGEYNAVSLPWEMTYPQGAGRETGWIGTSLEPSLKHADMAKALGCFGEKVTQPEQLPIALQRAIRAVDNGTPAVLEVVVPHIGLKEFIAMQS